MLLFYLDKYILYEFLVYVHGAFELHPALILSILYDIGHECFNIVSLSSWFVYISNSFVV